MQKLDAVPKTRMAADVWHTWPLLRGWFYEPIRDRKTDAGSAPAASLKVRGLAHSRADDRHRVPERTGFI